MPATRLEAPSNSCVKLSEPGEKPSTGHNSGKPAASNCAAISQSTKPVSLALSEIRIQAEGWGIFALPVFNRAYKASASAICCRVGSVRTDI